MADVKPSATSVGSKYLSLSVFILICVFVDVHSTNRVRHFKNHDRSNALEDIDSQTTVESRIPSDKRADWVSTVHIISMNHLDVGYDGIPGKQTGFINNVLHYYFHQYFPRAIKLGNDLKKGGYVETFIYTTHPWLVSMYLDCPPNFVLAGIKLQCPNVTEKAAFIQGVKDGYITWHASPMNLQPEFIPNPTMFGLALDISAKLDKRFGIVRKTKVMSQRDVPGMTRSVLPVLTSRGITGITVGVNNMSPPAALPKLFRWVSGDAEVISTWHGGGYPDPPGPTPTQPGGISIDDCVVLTDFPEALCFAFRSDNQGPPENVREILDYYEILRAQFPNAKLMASKLENYFSAADKIKNQLPVVDWEIGDTWIQGDASDPRKCAEVRAIGRVLARCIDSGRCNHTEQRFWNATRIFAKTFEHTWGLAQAIDLIHWNNQDFYANRNSENFTNCEKSWIEQRQVYQYALQAIGDHPVVDDIKNELNQLQPKSPDLTNYKSINITQQYTCPGGVTLKFGTDGSLIKYSINGTNWASEKYRLGEFVYQTFNDSDYDDFASQYSFNKDRNVGIHKENMSKNANPQSTKWDVNLLGLYKKIAAKGDKSSCEFMAHLTMADKESWSYYGAPRNIWIQYSTTDDPKSGIDITLQFFDKVVTRLPESLSVFFFQSPAKGASWKFSKLGGTVDPSKVVLNGSQYQHALDDGGMSYGYDGAAINIASPDVPVLIVSTEKYPHHSAFPVPLKPISEAIIGGGFNVYNNIWDTNWIFWYPYIQEDASFKARFFLRIK